MKMEDAFEEQWQNILTAARQAKAAYEHAFIWDTGAKAAEAAMFAANSAVRRFCDTERQIGREARQ